MKTPKVSVIMPVYNAEKYIRETIDSILGQTFTNFEFIIIDDGSIDKSIQIIKSYSDPRIRFYKNNINIGYVKTLNKLIDLCQGEYIARQDNDDISLHNRIEKQVLFLDKNIDIGVCGTNAVFFDNKKKKTLMPIGDNDIRAYMLFSNPMCHPTIMFRKSIFIKLNVDKYDESLSPAEDYALWFQISKKTKLANIPELLLKYRWHKNNTSQLKKDIQIEKASKIRREIYDFTLSYKISTKENLLLELISNTESINYDNLKSLEFFLLKILQKNMVIGYYKEITLINLCFYFWTKVCFKTPNLFLTKKIIIYLSSDLFKLSSLLNLISKKSINKFIYDKNN